MVSRDLSNQEIQLGLVPGTSIYLCDPNGNVYSLSSGYLRKLAPWKRKRGHWEVRLIYDGKLRTRLVHQLVLEVWGEPRKSKEYETRHLDDNKDNNHISNLVWGTHQENMADCIRNGKRPVCYGSSHKGSKLVESDIYEIFRMFKAGSTRTEIASLFKVSRAKISQILTKQAWKHVSVSEKDNDY